MAFTQGSDFQVNAWTRVLRRRSAKCSPLYSQSCKVHRLAGADIKRRILGDTSFESKRLRRCCIVYHRIDRSTLSTVADGFALDGIGQDKRERLPIRAADNIRASGE